MRVHKLSSMILAAALACCAVVAQADILNMGTGLTSLDMVTVGDSGNVPNGSYGAVGYDYKIAKYEVTNAQYSAFLNAVAKTDTYEVYPMAMASSTQGGITRSGISGDYIYTVKPGFANLPVVLTKWYHAVRFCNWLSNGQRTGLQDSTTTEAGVYTLTGIDSIAAPPDHSTLRGNKFFLPTDNEWYKAAFYKGGSTNAGYWTYATRSDTRPTSEPPSGSANSANYYDDVSRTGYALTHSMTRDPNQVYVTEVGAYRDSASAYGTLDQNGNVEEWCESPVSDCRSTWGGGWADQYYSLKWRSYADPRCHSEGIGFRVASAVPEPGSIAMLTGLALTASLYWWRRRA